MKFLCIIVPSTETPTPVPSSTSTSTENAPEIGLTVMNPVPLAPMETTIPEAKAQ